MFPEEKELKELNRRLQEVNKVIALNAGDVVKAATQLAHFSAIEFERAMLRMFYYPQFERAGRPGGEDNFLAWAESQKEADVKAAQERRARRYIYEGFVIGE